MEYAKLKELAINYTYESDFWESPMEYIQSFNLSIKDMQSLKFYINIQLNKYNRENKIAELTPIFENCISFQAENINNKERFVIFHPSTRKGYKYQLSYFDSLGAIMDEKSETLEDAIENFYKVSRDYKIINIIKAVA